VEGAANWLDDGYQLAEAQHMAAILANTDTHILLARPPQAPVGAKVLFLLARTVP